MKHIQHTILGLVVTAAVTAASTANAQNNPPSSEGAQQPVAGDTRTQAGALGSTQALPPPRSDNDPAPPTAMAAPGARVGLVEQAGVGGNTAYGRAGVMELGGSIGFSAASGQSSVSISPTIGWFFADNLQISGIFSYRYTNVNGNDANALDILAEPSFHLPFSRTLFAFVGVGLGLSYVDRAGAGFAVAPRVGMNIAVGRSGILTPALQLTYSTNDVISTNNGTLLAVNTAFSGNVGYTVMW